MIEALYIIGSAFALLVLWHMLREARRQLQQVTRERDAYAQALQRRYPREDDHVLPAGVVLGRYQGRPEE